MLCWKHFRMKSLIISQVSYSYGKRKALDNINLIFHEGEINVILGPNGAGKTTLFKLISNLLLGYEGEVYISDGFIRRKISNRDIGLLFEGSRSLFHKLNALENLVYFGVLKGIPPKIAKEKAKKFISDVGLDNKINEPLGKLSRGMQQKISFGASILHEPTILILDEPSLGMDFLGIDFLINCLKNYSRKSILLLATHDLKIAKALGQKAIIINDGKIHSEINLSSVQSSSSVFFVEHINHDTGENFVEECHSNNLLPLLEKIGASQLMSVHKKEIDLEFLLRKII
jgi:ABC-type multidrug transport system ATPase subunit